MKQLYIFLILDDVCDGIDE